MFLLGGSTQNDWRTFMGGKLVVVLVAVANGGGELRASQEHTSSNLKKGNTDHTETSVSQRISPAFGDYDIMDTFRSS